MGNGRPMSQGEILAETVAEELARADTCRREVQAILEKYNCVLEPIFHIDRHSIKGEIKFIANPRVPKHG